MGRLDWHMDLHYTGRPNRGALLRAVVCASEDGMTGFGDLARAWDALDAQTKSLLEKLEVTYTFSMQRRHMRFVRLEGYAPGPFSPKKPSDIRFPNFPEVAYPAVVTHPVTGRKVLEIVEQFLERIVAPHRHGLCNDEAVELLAAAGGAHAQARVPLFPPLGTRRHDPVGQLARDALRHRHGSRREARDPSHHHHGRCDAGAGDRELRRDAAGARAPSPRPTAPLARDSELIEHGAGLIDEFCGQRRR